LQKELLAFPLKIVSVLIMNTCIFLWRRTRGSACILNRYSFLLLYYWKLAFINECINRKDGGVNWTKRRGLYDRMSLEACAPLALISLAFVFWPGYLKSRIMTIPDFFGAAI
jgi:hypothetical protein